MSTSTSARPDSIIEGQSVHEARKQAGRFLAQEHPVEADVVIGVPDSGLDAALGYSEESGIPYGIGFIKNKYIGRTFIQGSQKQRENSVRIKLNAVSSTVKGKRVVLVDDSIVRGTTSARIIKLLRDAGAKEVHFRVSAPPFKYPCYFGTDIPDQKLLVATGRTVEQINEIIGADTLGYLSTEHVGQAGPQRQLRLLHGLLHGRIRRQAEGGAFDRYSRAPPERPSQGREKVRRVTRWKRAIRKAIAAAGVDITAGYRSVELMKQYVARTMNEHCIGGLGGFGGLFELDCTGYKHPVLVSGTDGVGTKLKIAYAPGQARHHRHRLRGHVRQRCHLRRCQAAVLPGLHRLRPQHPGKDRRDRQGRGRGLRAGRLLLWWAARPPSMPGHVCRRRSTIWPAFTVGVVDKEKILNNDTMKPGDVDSGAALHGRPLQRLLAGAQDL